MDSATGGVNDLDEPGLLRRTQVEMVLQPPAQQLAGPGLQNLFALKVHAPADDRVSALRPGVADTVLDLTPCRPRNREPDNGGNRRGGHQRGYPVGS